MKRPPLDDLGGFFVLNKFRTFNRVMKTSVFITFRNAANSFNETSAAQKEILLNQCALVKPSTVKEIKAYHDALLFSLAYPESEKLQTLALNEMQRLTLFLKSVSPEKKNKLILSGISNTQTDGAFSFSLTKWLIAEYKEAVSLHSFDESGTHPKDVLKYVFPEMEFEILSDEKLTAWKWIEKVSNTKNKHKQLAWLINQLGNLNVPELLSDQLFESLKAYITIKGSDKKFSRSFGKIQFSRTHYHSSGILKKFNEQEVINSKLPAPKKLTDNQKQEIINVSRTALALLNRETDPVTYCNIDGLLYYELEHGLSIALFSMLPERRLPIESYMGFMMFKNGYPMAYGGGWLFGSRSLLGINIFEAFRGGESAFVFAQLLRTYKQAFGAEYFEVEPYQFGKNNPEGIKSGAFWFYYRFGFRPVDVTLSELSKAEQLKISNDKTYRTPVEILKKFATGNVAALFGNGIKPLNPSLISKYITQKISKDYNGDRKHVELISKKNSIKIFNLKGESLKKNQAGINKLAVFIFLCIDSGKMNKDGINQMKSLVLLKSTSEVDYIKQLKKVNLKKVLSKECLDFISC
jgi:hypothetical protein